MKTSNKLLMVSYLFCFVVLQAKCAVFITDFEMNRMIELSAQRPYCHLHLDRGLIHSTLLNTSPMKMRQVPLESVKAIEEVCFEKKQLTGELQGGLGFVYPGTKWCGPGTLAKNESDLGRYVEEDRCCREHDRCPNTLNPGECRRSICNKGAFTRSHCDCDEKFRKCLQGLNTEIANTLGAAFFNVVQVTCFSVRPHCTSFHRNDDNCPFEYEPSKLYLPPRASSGRSLNSIDSNNDKINHNTLRRKSIQLLARSLFKDLIARPLRNFGNYLIVTKSAYFDPKTPIDTSKLIKINNY